METYIQKLQEYTKTRHNKNAIDLIEIVIKEAEIAAKEFGVDSILFVRENDQYHDENGFYKYDSAYYIVYPSRMNHKLLIEKLEEIGFKVHTERDRINAISW